MTVEIQSNKETRSRVPALRFPEFSGQWEEKRLGGIAIFLKGKNISKDDVSEDGKTECIRYGELYTHYKETIQSIRSQTNLNPEDLILSESNDVIIPASGETQWDIATASCILKDGVALGGDLNIIRNKESGVFLAYYLSNTKRRNIARLSQGNSVVHLYPSQLKFLRLSLPKKEEQQKIAGFLGMVDEKIEGLAKKKKLFEAYKKGVVQKIFSQEVRFKDENGNSYPDWEEKKLEGLCKIKTGKKDVNAGNPKGEYHFYTCAKDFTYSDNYSFEGESILIAGNAEVGLCQYYDGKFEAYQRTYILQHFSILGSYLFRYLSTYFRQYALGLKQTGAMSFIKIGMLNDFIVPVPSPLEQKKIAEFLTSLDEKISAIGNELNCAKDFKKGLLQQMFV